MTATTATPAEEPTARADEWAALRTEAEELAPDLVALRRAIHRRPELGTHNPETQAKILDALEPLGLEITTGDALTSVVATLRGSRGGPSFLLRADTDGLPMTEDTEWSDRSEIEGRAHVCGHDAHVAMLVAAATLLARRRDEIAGTVRFAFQPGEEGFGGADLMLAEGLLVDGLDEPVTGAFAIHVTPNAPAGFVVSRPGPLMAATDDFTVTVRGRGGHASTPHFGNDPLPVACEMVTALQTFVTRRVDAFDPAVLTVGRFASGTTTNVIPEEAQFAGTIRTVSSATRERMRQGFDRVVGGIAAAHECEVDIERRAGYPVTVNDAATVDFVREVTDDVLGPGHWIDLPTPVMGAEDFSYILAQAPGAMVLLGVCPDDIDNSLTAPACHSNRMRLNEAPLPSGAALHAAVALRWLAARA